MKEKERDDEDDDAEDRHYVLGERADGGLDELASIVDRHGREFKVGRRGARVGVRVCKTCGAQCNPFWGCRRGG